MSGLAEDELDESPARLWLRRLGLAVFLLAAVLGAWLVLKGLTAGKSGPQKHVTRISVMPDTPPPPPPPPPKEQAKEIMMEQPKSKEAQPPAEAMKMEGAAGDGSSPFAAGKVSNEYIGGKLGMAAYAWYTGQIKARIEEALAAQKELAKAQYRVVVHIWFARDGRMERAELQGSSGDQATDELIRKALAGIVSVAEAPPEDMPQPVKLRITSRNKG